MGKKTVPYKCNLKIIRKWYILILSLCLGMMLTSAFLTFLIFLPCRPCLDKSDVRPRGLLRPRGAFLARMMCSATGLFSVVCHGSSTSSSSNGFCIFSPFTH